LGETCTTGPYAHIYCPTCYYLYFLSLRQTAINTHFATVFAFLFYLFIFYFSNVVHSWRRPTQMTDMTKTLEQKPTPDTFLIGVWHVTSHWQTTHRTRYLSNLNHVSLSMGEFWFKPVYYYTITNPKKRLKVAVAFSLSLSWLLLFISCCTHTHTHTRARRPYNLASQPCRNRDEWPDEREISSRFCCVGYIEYTI
jgi:hypothetical protein